jgi:hypothetical protein
MLLYKIEKMIEYNLNYTMEYNYTEFTTHWLYNDNIIIVKPQFDEDINLIEFDNTILSLVFSDYNKIEHIIEKIYYIKNFKESNFNCSVDNLPSTLLNLTFGHNFNCTVDNLPQNLTNLTFGYYFNQSVDNLPQNLTNLTFGNFITSIVFGKLLKCLLNFLL